MASYGMKPERFSTDTKRNVQQPVSLPDLAAEATESAPAKSLALDRPKRQAAPSRPRRR